MLRQRGNVLSYSVAIDAGLRRHSSSRGRIFPTSPIRSKPVYIAAIDAGTFRRLVEAAEARQVSIIHPGKPLSPNEPGLSQLIGRAEPLQ